MAIQPEDLKNLEKHSEVGGQTETPDAQQANRDQSAATEVSSLLSSDSEPILDPESNRVSEAYDHEKTRPLSPEEQQKIGELRSELKKLESASDLSPEERKAQFGALYNEIGDAWRAGDKALAQAMRQRLGIPEGEEAGRHYKGDDVIYGPLSFIDELPSSFTLEMNKLQMDAEKLQNGQSRLPFYNDSSLIDHYMEINPGQGQYARVPRGETGK